MKVKKVESTIKPNSFRIGERKDNRIEVVFFDDIEEITKTSEDGTEQTIYSYYEYPISVVYRDNLEDYINEDIETWLNLAKDNFINARAAEIRSIRNQLLTESDNYVLIDRLGITIPDNISATTMLDVLKQLFSNLGDVLNGPWAKYRQALRDITKQPNFPFDVDFPISPDEEVKK